jgi:aspartate/tyrosine/aromatic aminotransferase
MMLDRLSPQAPDALLALIRLYGADPRADKIDLGVGVYRTEEGDTPVFAAIKAAEAGQGKQIAEATQHGFAAVAEIVKVLTKLGVKIPAGVMQ